MTDQEKIAALAAELTRINKMPKSVFKVHGKPHFAIMNKADKWMRCDEAALAALSGVAAEVLQDAQIVIIRCQVWGPDDTSSPAWEVWEVWQFDHDGSYFIDQFETRHKALIAALRQVEVKT